MGIVTDRQQPARRSVLIDCDSSPDGGGDHSRSGHLEHHADPDRSAHQHRAGDPQGTRQRLAEVVLMGGGDSKGNVTPAAEFVVDILAFFAESYRTDQGFAAPPVHDPCAVPRVIDPSVMTVRPAHVEVELAGRLTTGMTVCDFRGHGGAALDTAVAVTLDAAKFWDMVVGSITAIGVG
ncbi:MAG: nucleoside hydrolase [Nakamurella sp.]